MYAEHNWIIEETQGQCIHKYLQVVDPQHCVNLLDGQCWLSHSRLNQFIVQSLVNKMTHDIYYNGILKHNRFILFNCIFSKYLRHLCWTQFTFRSRFSNHKQVNIERNVIQKKILFFFFFLIIFSILKYWQNIICYRKLIKSCAIYSDTDMCVVMPCLFILPIV